MKLPLPLQILNVLCAILFALFAWVQANDIDPETYYKPSSLDAALWFLFYGMIGVLFAVALFRSFPMWLLAIAAIACLIEFFLTVSGLWENVFGPEPFTLTGYSMSAADPRVELTRECLGAVIALLGVALLFWEQKTFPKRNVETQAESD